MKVWISYFYNVRFLKPNQIPVSTAKWDPRWFHNNLGQDHVFFDKRGIANGFRLKTLAPGKTCDNLCTGSCEPKVPEHCAFLEAYRAQLSRLDFDSLMVDLERIVSTVEKYETSTEDYEIVLMVYEAKDNPCSERQPLIDWFRENGYELEEWSK